jgi:trypsin-like peptidase
MFGFSSDEQMLGDLKRTQILASGVTVRQDFRDAVRMVFFDTGDPAWQYATHGGSAFLVNFQGRPYGFTCRHVIGDFDWANLVITDTKFGQSVAGVKAINYARDPQESATETDILDVVVIQFRPDVDLGYFKDTTYLLDLATTATSEPGDALLVAGALKEKSEIGESNIAPVFCLLEFADVGTSGNDPTLRHAVAQFVKPEFDSIVGLSGAPVYNRRKNGLCGMVVRGSINKGRCELWYVDLYDMMHLLKAVHEERSATYYRKHMVKSA